MSTVELRFVTETHNKVFGLRYPDFVSMGIRHITWSQYSHVEFVLDEEWQEAMHQSATVLLKALLDSQTLSNLTIGARHKDGVQIRPSDYEPYPLDDRFLVEVTPEQKQTLMKFVLDQVGKPYDTTAILGILAHRDWRRQDSWFCSELVAAAFEAADAPLLYVTPHVNRITPRDTSLSIKLIPKQKQVPA